MTAIVVTGHATEIAEMALAERPQPQAGGYDDLVELHRSGFTPSSLTWPDRLGHEHSPSIVGHEVAAAVGARCPQGHRR